MTIDSPEGDSPDSANTGPSENKRPEATARTDKRPRGAADRVVRTHRQTRPTVAITVFAMAAAFGAWALGGSSWVAIHLMAAVGLVTIISGVSLMLTVTWSAAPAPPDAAVLVQRFCIAIGAVAIIAGRHFDLGAPVVVPGAALYLTGLALLAALLALTVRRGVERRYDPAVIAYVAALCAGCAGVVVGTVMALDGSTPARVDTHITLNVLGLVGLVVVGTLPFFTATVGRSRMAPKATASRIVMVVAWQSVAVAVISTAMSTQRAPVAAAGLAAYGFGLVAVLALLPRPTRRQLEWAGPRLIAIWAGTLWWAVAVVASAVVVGADGRATFSRQWVWTLVVAGYGQILWGSLAYLMAVLRGGGHRLLAEGFATTRSWLGLVAANLTGVALATSQPKIAAATTTVWLADTAWRAARVGFGRRALTGEHGNQER